MRGTPLGLAALAGALLSASARADTPPAAVITVDRSERASDCPDSSALTQRVNAIAGSSALTVAPAPETRLRLHVEITAGDAGYAAEIRATGSRRGVRRIADIGRDCGGLADALAVTLAIIIDDERAEPAEPVPAPGPPPVFPRAPSPQPPPEPLVWRPYVTAAATVGVLEKTAFGPALGVALDIGRVIAGVDGFWLPARSFQLSPGESDISLLGSTAYACWNVPATSRLWLGACAHFSAGRLTGSAAGYSQNRSAARPWFAPGLGAMGGGPISGALEWFAQGRLFVPLHRERFVIENVGVVHETPPLGGLLGIGLAAAIR